MMFMRKAAMWIVVFMLGISSCKAVAMAILAYALITRLRSVMMRRFAITPANGAAIMA